MTTVMVRDVAQVLKLIKHNSTFESAHRHGIRTEYETIESAMQNPENTQLSLLTAILCFAFMQDHKHSYSDSFKEKLHEDLLRKIDVGDECKTTVFEAMLDELKAKYQDDDFAKYFNALYLLRGNISLIDTTDKFLYNILTDRIEAALKYFLNHSTINDLLCTDLGGNLGTALQEHSRKMQADSWEFVEVYGDKDMTLSDIIAIRVLLSFAKAYSRPRQVESSANNELVQAKFSEFDDLVKKHPEQVEAAIKSGVLSYPFIIDYFAGERANWLFEHDDSFSLFTFAMHAPGVAFEEYDSSEQAAMESIIDFFNDWSKKIDVDLLSIEDRYYLRSSMNGLLIGLLEDATYAQEPKYNAKDFYAKRLDSYLRFMDSNLFDPSYTNEQGQSLLHALLSFMRYTKDGAEAIDFALHVLNALYEKGVDISLAAPIKEEGDISCTLFPIVMRSEFFGDKFAYMYYVLGTHVDLSPQQAVAILQDVLPDTLLQPNYTSMDALMSVTVVPLVYNGFDASKVDKSNLLNFIDILVGFIRRGENANQCLINFFANPQLWQDVESSSQTLLLLRRYQLPLDAVLQQLKGLNDRSYMSAICCLIWSKATAFVEPAYNVFHYIAAKPDICAQLDEEDFLRELPSQRDSFDDDFFDPYLGYTSVAVASMQGPIANETDDFNFYANDKQVLRAMYRHAPEQCAFSCAAAKGNSAFFLLFLSVFEGLLLHKNVPGFGIINWDPEIAALDKEVKERITDLLVSMCQRGVNLNQVTMYLERKTGGGNKLFTWGFDNKLLLALDGVRKPEATMLHASQMGTASLEQVQPQPLEEKEEEKSTLAFPLLGM